MSQSIRDLLESLKFPSAKLLEPKQSYASRSIWSKKPEHDDQSRDHLIYKWMRHCLENHDHCAERDLASVFPEASDILLIDVKRMCLVKATTAENYVTLSYVWGQNTVQYMTLLNKFQTLLQPGSLNHIWNKISKVIQDTIILTREIGATFLWCDTLCIVQDDKVNKPQQLALMGEIYNRAMATLIAVYGESANTKLMRQSLPKHMKIRKPMGTEDIMEEIEDSKYCTRGWCYQEQLLAKRRIYFMEDEVIFHCREDMFTSLSSRYGVDFEYWAHSEYKAYHPSVVQQVDELHERGHGSEWPDLEKHGANAHKRFLVRVVEDFSARDLTNRNDVLDACSGVLTALQGQSKWPFVAGLPLVLLPESLLWIPQVNEPDSQHHFERRTYKAGKQKLAYRFPSWSWAGWCGAVAFISGIKTFSSHESLLKDIHVYSDQIWREGFESTAFLHKHPLAALEASGNPSLGLGSCIAVLGFETSAVSLSRLLGKSLPTPRNNIYHLTTVDVMLQSAGFLYGTCVDPWHAQSCDDATYEFVLLAKARSPVYSSFPNVPENPSDLVPPVTKKNTFVIKEKNMHDMDRPELLEYLKDYVKLETAELRADHNPHDAYDVMLVKWQDGLAERVGVGQIIVGVWSKLSPMRKEILLR